MTRKTWTTLDQDAWLTALIPAFLKAKEAKVAPDFVTEKAKLFLQQWPALPRPKDLEEAKGNEEIAKHLIEDARTGVWLVLYIILSISNQEPGIENSELVS
jgi:hypothetical protein